MEGAVGLAAQQCAINARIIIVERNNFLSKKKHYKILINPRIVQRSNERYMKVWTEQCLVLPPTFPCCTLPFALPFGRDSNGNR
jgi:peptide deformylase